MMLAPWQDRLVVARNHAPMSLAGFAFAILETFTPACKVHRPDVLVIGGNHLLGTLHALRLVEHGLDVCLCCAGDDPYWDYASAAHPAFRSVIEQVAGLRIGHGVSGDWERTFFAAIGERIGAARGRLSYVPQRAAYVLSNRRSATRLLVDVKPPGKVDGQMDCRATFDMRQVLARHGLPVAFRWGHHNKNMIQPYAALLTSTVNGFVPVEVVAGDNSTMLANDTPGVFATGTGIGLAEKRADALRLAVKDVLQTGACVGSVTEYVEKVCKQG